MLNTGISAPGEWTLPCEGGSKCQYQNDSVHCAIDSSFNSTSTYYCVCRDDAVILFFLLLLFCHSRCYVEYLG